MVVSSHRWDQIEDSIEVARYSDKENSNGPHQKKVGYHILPRQIFSK